MTVIVLMLTFVIKQKKKEKKIVKKKKGLKETLTGLLGCQQRMLQRESFPLWQQKR